MAAALRVIERMEKREVRRKAELESSEPSVKVRSQSEHNRELPWFNGLQHNSDGSSTDAASEHVCGGILLFVMKFILNDYGVEE